MVFFLYDSTVQYSTNPGLCSVATVPRSWYRRTGGVWGVDYGVTYFVPCGCMHVVSVVVIMCLVCRWMDDRFDVCVCCCCCSVYSSPVCA